MVESADIPTVMTNVDTPAARQGAYARFLEINHQDEWPRCIIKYYKDSSEAYILELNSDGDYGPCAVATVHGLHLHHPVGPRRSQQPLPEAVVVMALRMVGVIWTDEEDRDW